MLQDILLCTVTQARKLSDEAVANLDRIDEEAAKEVRVKEQKLASEQEKVHKKTQEYKGLLEEFESLKAAKVNLEEKLKAESENLVRCKAQMKLELDDKDKQLDASIADSNEAKNGSTKAISKVSKRGTF